MVVQHAPIILEIIFIISSFKTSTFLNTLKKQSQQEFMNVNEISYLLLKPLKLGPNKQCLDNRLALNVQDHAQL
jgi:hypothetical protein